MAHLGDFDTSTVVYGKFTTYRPSTGASYTLGGTPALSVYKDNSTTQSTTGVTLTADFDSVTGLNHFAIDTSADGSFYAAGSFFDIVITTGTVDSVSVAGSVVGSFTLRKNSALKPTTAARTLDVSAGGEAGVDWANVGSPTTTLNLSATTIKTATDVETDTADIQTRLPAALVGGRIDANMGAISSDATAADNAEAFFDGTGYAGTNNVIPLVTTTTTATNVTTVNGLAANVITAAATAADFTTEIQTGLATAAALTTVDTVVDAIKAVTDLLPDAGALTSLATAANLATVDTVVDAILVDTAEIGVAGAGLTALATQASVNALPTAAANAAAFGTRQITEAYRANGAAPTADQAFSEILAHLGEASISGTTKTIKKFDHSTDAETFTLDDATAPTSITRAS